MQTLDRESKRDTFKALGYFHFQSNQSRISLHVDILLTIVRLSLSRQCINSIISSLTKNRNWEPHSHWWQ